MYIVPFQITKVIFNIFRFEYTVITHKPNVLLGSEFYIYNTILCSKLKKRMFGVVFRVTINGKEYYVRINRNVGIEQRKYS